MNEIFPQGYAWIDSKYVELAEAKIPILDWGFLRSDATYDVVHVWKGRFFRLDNHIDRFFESAKKSLLRRDEIVKKIEKKLIRRDNFIYSFSHFDLNLEIFFKEIRKIDYPKNKWLNIYKYSNSQLPTVMKKIVEKTI